MTKTFEAIGLLSFTVAIVAIPINFTSGTGIILSLIALTLSGVSALAGRLLYALLTLSISTTSILFVSVLFKLNEAPGTLIFYIGIPYLLFGIFLSIGYYRHLRWAQQKDFV